MANERTGGQMGNEHSAGVHTVQRGDNLYAITSTLNGGKGEAWRELYALNRHVIGDNPDEIQPGQKLAIPRSWLTTQSHPPEQNAPQQHHAVTNPAPAQAGEPILIGSVIHLENQKDGYLRILKNVGDEPVIKMYADPNVHAFVATHQALQTGKDDDGSARWQILSADGAKHVGQQLAIGDRIHLLNMRLDAGYLDSFEWVDRFKGDDGKEFFADYPMQIGVFTSDASRGRGLSGTWVIRSNSVLAPNSGTPVVTGDIIELENVYPTAGKLYTYGEVTQHAAFNKTGLKNNYEGYRRFVFTGPTPTAQEEVIKPFGSPQWKISLAESKEDQDEDGYSIYHQHGGEDSPLHYEGIFIIGGRPTQQVARLKFDIGDSSTKLSGKVAYGDETLPKEDNFDATYRGQNVYDIYLRSERSPASEGAKPDTQWRLGSRDYQRVVAMDITIDEKGGLAGKITYVGEKALVIKGFRGTTKPADFGVHISSEHSPEWVKGRISRMEGTIVETYRRLSDFTLAMISCVIDNLPVEYQKQPTYGAMGTLVGTLDPTFQIEQLLNLYTLSQQLNAFSRYTLYALMNQSVETHRAANDGSIAPLHLFRQCFQQIGLDHALLQQATTQRRWRAEDSAEAKELNRHADKLLKLDKLAIKAIMPFRQLLLGDTNEPLAVITYLSEKTHIHLVPYTKQFILIGVSDDHEPPAAGIFENEDLLSKNFHYYEIMAIPHEIGHYLYQHGALQGQTFLTLSKKFEDHPYYRWCEEIFADVYSCIVAGPLAAISMQALLMSIDRDRAWKDDEDHPIPVLRAFIFTEILRVLHEIEPKRYPFGRIPKATGTLPIVDKLDQDWSKVLTVWRYDHMVRNKEDAGPLDRPYRPARVYMHDRSTLHIDSIVNVERVMRAIRPIIDEYAHILCTFARTEVNFGVTQMPRDEQNDEQRDGPLSLAFPWTVEDDMDIKPYNVLMADMIDKEVVHKTVSMHCVQDPKTDEGPLNRTNPDEQLQNYLKGWSDSGPISGGGSGGTKGPLFQLFF